MSTGFVDPGLEHAEYLRDESRRTGRAEGIAFPRTESELRELVRDAAVRKRPMTIQGARTGITAGAVPQGGVVVNLSRMNRILGVRHDPARDALFLTVQPGLLLSELRDVLNRPEKLADRLAPAETRSLAESAVQCLQETGPWWFTPDPTEASASLGGMAACNASGARTFAYGATRPYIHRARVVLADGDVVSLERGVHRARGRQFELQTEGGRTVAGVLPTYPLPPVKSAAGYFVADDMDLLDLFIAAEGTLGIFSELEIRLLHPPVALWGVMAFFAGDADALRFVRAVRAAAVRPAAIEYFDSRALSFLRGQKASNPAFHELPELPAGDWTAIYVEYHGEEPVVEECVSRMSECLTACGGNEDQTWLASDARELQRLKDFRHAVPEAVNLLIDLRRKQEPRLTKLGTDLAVPDANLEEVIALYHRDLQSAGLEYVVFGHIGNNHVHVNILPRSLSEYERGRALYLKWAQTVVAWGGTVSGEHGIGKLKTALLNVMYGADGMRQMRAVKSLFDPEGLLNLGNLFEQAIVPQ